MIKRIVLIKYLGIVFLKKEISVIDFSTGGISLSKKTIKYFLFGNFKVKEITENYLRE